MFEYFKSIAIRGYKVATINRIMQACAIILEVAIIYFSLARHTK